ncbi:MAG: ABC transporter ATP-binding protein [Chloroflexi bacterium]|nr:ABC transporter ATP-binding protein [Chloroflexota bacterium]
MIRAQDLHKVYHVGGETQHVLNGVDLTIPAGQFTAIMGSSGSGKSTLLNLLSGLDIPTSGTIAVGGRTLDAMSSDELAAFRAKTIGLVFQSYYLVPTLNAMENVALPGVFVGMPKEDRDARALALLTRLGLADRVGHRINELSGGQRQRVAIARALFNDPPLIMADEPTGALDEENGRRVVGWLRSLAVKQGKTVVMVTHEEKLTRYVDRVIHLTDGRIVSDQLVSHTRSAGIPLDSANAPAARPSRPNSSIRQQ